MVATASGAADHWLQDAFRTWLEGPNFIASQDSRKYFHISDRIGMRIVACMTAATSAAENMKRIEALPDSTDGHSPTAGIRRRRWLLSWLATFVCLATVALFFNLLRVQADDPAGHLRQPADGALTGSVSPAVPNLEPNTTLPPLPAGVAELKFSEFFVQPVGPLGLELTEKLRGLEGRRVRILGYMAQQAGPPPGGFLLTPFAVKVCDHDNRLAEDFPASAVLVSVPTLRGEPVPYAPGLMLLTGRLTTGNRAEPDGRISLVRLALDPPENM